MKIGIDMKIKIATKEILSRLGWWAQLEKLRRRPAIRRWIKGGYSSVAPHPVKMRIVSSYLTNYRLRNFLETGTYHGDTLEFIARSGANCTSIELSEALYTAACRNSRDIQT